jgi:hypothetical protein
LVLNQGISLGISDEMFVAFWYLFSEKLNQKLITFEYQHSQELAIGVVSDGISS